MAAEARTRHLSECHLVSAAPGAKPLLPRASLSLLWPVLFSWPGCGLEPPSVLTCPSTRFSPPLRTWSNLRLSEGPNIHPAAGHHAALLPGKEQEGAQLPPAAFPGARLLPPSGDRARARQSRCEARRGRAGSCQGRRLFSKPPRFLEPEEATPMPLGALFACFLVLRFCGACQRCPYCS